MVLTHSLTHLVNYSHTFASQAFIHSCTHSFVFGARRTSPWGRNVEEFAGIFRDDFTIFPLRAQFAQNHLHINTHIYIHVHSHRVSHTHTHSDSHTHTHLHESRCFAFTKISRFVCFLFFWLFFCSISAHHCQRFSSQKIFIILSLVSVFFPGSN